MLWGAAGVRSKNKRAATVAEREHIERVAALECVVCDEPPPSEVHEPEQGMWWIALPTCPLCHRGPDGWHGTRLRWKLRKVTELSAIDKTIKRLMTQERT